MPDTSARLSLPYLLPAQAQKHVTHNEALARLDLLVQLAVEGIGAAAPPPVPTEGQIWALGPAATGAWTGQPGGTLAAWDGVAWVFVPPQEGYLALDKASGALMHWTGSDWDRPDLANLDGLGVNTACDAVNRLAVASDASLFSHDGAGHQLKLNKAASGDTGSVLFQTGWSGRAEIGTAGNDGFAIKTSADGSAWTTAMAFDPATGIAAGAAVQQDASDSTPGRLARVDYTYGPANLVGTVAQSGGTPTGAVIETGTNANGSYSRFADGTQICWAPSFATASGGPATWTFPALFGSADVAVTATSSFSGDLRVISASDATPSTVELRSWSTVGAQVVAPRAHLVAYGRWY